MDQITRDEIFGPNEPRLAFAAARYCDWLDRRAAGAAGWAVEDTTGAEDGADGEDEEIDPSQADSVRERILRHVIKIPCTTREVAESLDIPLNSASATLSQLAARSLISHQGMQWGPPAGWQSRAE